MVVAFRCIGTSVMWDKFYTEIYSKVMKVMQLCIRMKKTGVKFVYIFTLQKNLKYVDYNNVTNKISV